MDCANVQQLSNFQTKRAARTKKANVSESLQHTCDVHAQNADRNVDKPMLSRERRELAEAEAGRG